MLSWAPRSWARQVLLPPTSRADKLLPRALLAVSAVRRALSSPCDSDAPPTGRSSCAPLVDVGAPLACSTDLTHARSAPGPETGLSDSLEAWASARTMFHQAALPCTGVWVLRRARGRRCSSASTARPPCASCRPRPRRPSRGPRKSRRALPARAPCGTLRDPTLPSHKPLYRPVQLAIGRVRAAAA